MRNERDFDDQPQIWLNGPVTFEPESGISDDLVWWLSGGFSLLLWTGLALLLTTT